MALKICALKAPGFGERKSQYLEDIAILTGATVVKDELGLSLDKVGPEVLGNAARVGSARSPAPSSAMAPQLELPRA